MNKTLTTNMKQREIKFRAWHKAALHDNKGSIDQGKFNMTYWKLGQGLDNSWFYNNAIAVMQYTGLKDKNGKEIYEGDIVKKFNSVYEVKFDDVYVTTDPGSGYESVLGWGAFEKYDGDPLRTEYFEVIGNIYENPNLVPKIELTEL